jgi:hypothetical protein
MASADPAEIPFQADFVVEGRPAAAQASAGSDRRLEN